MEHEFAVNYWKDEKIYAQVAHKKLQIQKPKIKKKEKDAVIGI